MKFIKLKLGAKKIFRPKIHRRKIYRPRRVRRLRRPPSSSTAT